MKRHLSLRTERLTDLTPDELGAFAGGAGPDVTLVCVDLPTRWEMCAVVKRFVNDALASITCCSGC